MSQKLFFSILIVLTGLFFSFKPNSSEQNLVGSWRVESELHKDGTVQKGTETLTFSEDGSFVNRQDNGLKSTGGWLYLPKKELLKMSDKQKEKWAKFDVLKFTENELILKDKRATYNIVRIN